MQRYIVSASVKDRVVNGMGKLLARDTTDVVQRFAWNLGIALPLVTAATLLVTCPVTPPDRGVTLTYRVVGQCDSLFGSVDGNGNPIADQPGTVNLVIHIFKAENNRPQAVDFKLVDRNLFINLAEGRSTFDFDSLVRSPSPFDLPAGAVRNTNLFYLARIPGLPNRDHPSLDSANINWHVLYDTTGLPDGQAVLLIKSPDSAGGQVQAICNQLEIIPGGRAPRTRRTH